MNVIVKPQKALGRLLSPQEQEGRPSFAGSLEIIAKHSAALEAVVLIARLIDGADMHRKRSVLELHDAVLLWFGDSSLSLRVNANLNLTPFSHYRQSKSDPLKAPFWHQADAAFLAV